ncbi:TonB-dependent receptor [Asticcacaulis sp.]|uniref:TonB-dependent receptor n=1 Tax=Asticcacaulis sp. TaxID=1872648 RepID=UPI00261CEF4E|nr:TonB-dependent receptor [Asticcacaulis sp.]
MRLNRNWVAGLYVAILAGLVPATAIAQSVIDCQFPEQTLGKTLTALARAGKITVLFDPALVKGLNSRPLNGHFAAREALNRILMGSGLQAVQMSAGQFIIERMPSQRTTATPSVQGPERPLPEPDLVPVVVVQRSKSELREAEVSKRGYNGILETATSAEIAKFPEANLAEALQLLPGSALARDQGEGRTLSVRGIGPELSLVEINGIEAQAVTDGPNFGSYRGRGFDFNVFPSEIFAEISTSKTTRASQPEGSLGASVFLTTPKALEQAPQPDQLSLTKTYNDLSKAVGSRVNASLSRKTNDSRFGWTVSASWSRTPFEIQGLNSGFWNTGTSNGGYCRPTLNSGGICDVAPGEYASAVQAYALLNAPGVLAPQFYRFTSISGLSTRSGVAVGLQWCPSDDTLITADYLVSELSTRRIGHYLFPIGFSRGAAQGGKPEIVPRDVEVDGNGSVVYGRFDNVDIRSEVIFDEYKTRFEQGSIQVSRAFGPRLRFKGALGFSRSNFINPKDVGIHLDRYNVDNFIFDLRGSGQNNPSFSFGFDVKDPPEWYFGPRVLQNQGTGYMGPEIRYRPNFVRNEFDVLKGQLIYPVSSDIEIVAGIQWKRYGFNSEVFKFTEGDFDFPVPQEGLASLGEMFCGLGRFKVSSSTPVCWFAPDPEAFAKTYSIYGNVGRTVVSRDIPLARGFNQSVTETDLAAFVEWTFEGMWGAYPIKADAGLRVIETHQNSEFYNEANLASPSAPRLETVSRRYVDTLPTANIALELSPTQVVRLGLAKVMARPPLTNIAAATALNIGGGSRQVISGNPLIKPIRGATIDLAAEWYPSRDLNLSLGLFYKRISTYIQNYSYAGSYASTGLSETLLENTGAAPSDDFLITEVINTRGGEVNGLEFNLRWRARGAGSLFSGLGLDLNYTQIKSDIEYFLDDQGQRRAVHFDLLNLSPRTARATLFYRITNLEAQVTGVHRSAYLTSVPGARISDAAGVDGSFYLSAALAYKITPSLQLRLEGLNLTDEPSRTWEGLETRRLVDVQWSGRTVSLGLNYSF